MDYERREVPHSSIPHPIILGVGAVLVLGGLFYLGTLFPNSSVQQTPSAGPANVPEQIDKSANPITMPESHAVDGNILDLSDREIKLQSTIVDFDKLDKEQEMLDPKDIPTTEVVYSVVFNTDTGIVPAGTILKVGMRVGVEARENVYNTDTLTAIQIFVLPNFSQPAPSGN